MSPFDVGFLLGALCAFAIIGSGSGMYLWARYR